MSGFAMKPLVSTGQSFVIDPVCGMKVNPQNPPAKTLYQGRTYYFCSDLCKQLFEREPAKYVQAEGG